MVALGRLGDLAFGQNVNPKDEIETRRGTLAVINNASSLRWVLAEHSDLVDAPVFRDGNVIRIPSFKAESDAHNRMVTSWCDKYGVE